MADQPPSIADRIRAAVDAASSPGTATQPIPTSAAPPAPGFHFGLGERVLDLTTGARGTIRAAYYGAAIGRVYEIAIDQASIVVRAEPELERDRPFAPAPPSVPRI